MNKECPNESHCVQTFHNLDTRLQLVETYVLERKEQWKWMMGLLASILIAVISQLGVTIWFASEKNAQIQTLTSIVTDHEVRLRVVEKVR